MKTYEVTFENVKLIGKKRYIRTYSAIRVEANDKFEAMMKVKKEYPEKMVNTIQEIKNY